MTTYSIALLGASKAAFLAAASSAKAWTLHPGWLWLVVTLALYTLGNLIMLRLIREFGMGIALSLSAVVQLVAVNVIALVVFGERLSNLQTVGIVLAIAAIALITLAPEA